MSQRTAIPTKAGETEDYDRNIDGVYTLSLSISRFLKHLPGSELRYRISPATL